MTEVRSFHDCVGIISFASVAKPLHKLTEKGIKLLWTEECDESFRTLKELIMYSLLLAYADRT